MHNMHVWGGGGGGALDAAFIKLSETLVVDKTPSILALLAITFLIRFFCATHLKNVFQKQLPLSAKIVF